MLLSNRFSTQSSGPSFNSCPFLHDNHFAKFSLRVKSNVAIRISKIIQQCPDIGKVIETYVQDRNVGADAWTRTCVLTFDGNIHLKENVT